MSQDLSTDLRGTVLVVPAVGRGLGKEISKIATDLWQDRIGSPTDRSEKVVK